MKKELLICLTCNFEFTDNWILNNREGDEGESYFICEGEIKSESYGTSACINHFHTEVGSTNNWMGELYNALEKRYKLLKNQQIWAKNHKLGEFI